MANMPLNVQESMNLQRMGFNQMDIAFGKVTMDSDKWICIRSDGPPKTVAYIDASNGSVVKNPMEVESAIMNPTTKVLAVRAGKNLQVSNLDMKSKVGGFKMPDNADVLYWKWINNNTIALVTQQSVFHWAMDGNPPKKFFDRKPELEGSQIINYEISKDGVLALLSGIKKGPAGIEGVVQLFASDRGASQIIPGNCGCFGQLSLNNGPEFTVLACVERKAGMVGRIMIKQLSGTFAPPPAEVHFPQGAEQDFPLNMCIDPKHQMVYMVSKMGTVFLFDIMSGQTIFRRPLNCMPILMTKKSTDGVFVIAQQTGQVFNCTIIERNVVPFIMETLKNQQLAIDIASRLGLPGAENIFKTQLDQLFKQNNPRALAEFAIRCPAVRTQDLINKIKQMPPGQEGNPLSVYMQSILATSKLNAIETVELCTALIKGGRQQMVTDYITQDKITCCEQLGDMMTTVDAKTALQIYYKGNCHAKIVNCFVSMGDLDKVKAYCEKTGYTPDHALVIGSMVKVNPEKASEYAIHCWEQNPSSVNASAVADAFIAVNAIKEVDKFLFKVLNGDKPEDGPLQTKLLEVNIRGGITQIVDTIFSNKMFSHYDRVTIAHLCEQAGMAQRAIEHYTDLNDIKRVMANPRLIQGMNPEFMIQFFANMNPENRMACLKDMLSMNINSLQTVVKIAQKCPESDANLFIPLFEQYDPTFNGLFYYLGAILHQSENPLVHSKYIQAAVKLGQIQEVERVCRESNCYDPKEVKTFLLSVHLPDPRPLIRVCDRFGFVEELTDYLFSHKLVPYLEIYVGKVAGQNTPKVIGKLIELNAPEELIRGLLGLARSTCPAEQLVEEVEKRNRLKLILPWLEARVNEGSQDPGVHNAAGKLYVTLNKDPQEFLLKNQFYDSAVVGAYCEKVDPYLAYLAYRRAWGPCDQELIRVTNENGLLKDQARYLVERQDPELWDLVLTDENKLKSQLVDQVVNTALPESTNPEEVASTVKAFMANGLTTELIGLLERLVLQGSDFSEHESLQNLLIITAMTNNPTKVMEYIGRLSNYDHPKIAERCVAGNLFEEAFFIYKKIQDHASAVNVLIQYINAGDRAYEYAERVNIPEIWSIVARYQLDNGYVSESIDSYIKAKDYQNYPEVITAAEAASEWAQNIKYLMQVRIGVKDPIADTSLVYSFARLERYTELEEFVLSPNVAQIVEVGDRLFDEKLFESARILFNASGNNAKLASCWLKLNNFKEALDAAKKANSIKTWKEVCFAACRYKEYKLAHSAALSIIIAPDHLDEVVEFYEKLGLYDEILVVFEAGINLENAHTGIFTMLGVLYSKYREEKLMEHIKVYFQKCQIARLVRACEEGRFWPELVYLQETSEEFDFVIRTMVEHSSACFEHSKFIQCIGKVKNTELYYTSVEFYMREHPMELKELLNRIIPNLDHSRATHIVQKAGHLSLIKEYLETVQTNNISAVNEALHELYVEDENYEDLRTSIETYDNFDQIALAQSLERNELLEFRRISALLFKMNKQYEHSIDISKKDIMYREAIDTARTSTDSKLVDALLAFFVEQNDNECYAACLYSCYDYVKPDVAIEVAYRNGIMDFVMPYIIQYVRETNLLLKEIDERTRPPEEEETNYEQPVNPLMNMGIPLAIANNAFNEMGGMQPGMMPGMMAGMVPGMMQGMGGMMPGMNPGMMPGMQPGMMPGQMGGGGW